MKTIDLSTISGDSSTNTMRPSLNSVTKSLQPARRLAKRMLGRHRLSGPELWKRYNMNQMQGLEAALNRNDRSLQDFSSILDFGCGPGRLTQHLCGLAQDAQVFGCDTDPESVTEAQRLCPRGHFHINDPTPPLLYDNDQFDLVWSYSVFTNLSEESHEAWLKELARILRPGGVMVHTIHSHEYLRRVAHFSPENLGKYQFSGSLEEFIRLNDGFYYISPDHWPPDYGWAVISKEYVSAQWPALTGTSLLEQVEGAIESYPEGCQDVVILAKDPIHRHF